VIYGVRTVPANEYCTRRKRSAQVSGFAGRRTGFYVLTGTEPSQALDTHVDTHVPL